MTSRAFTLVELIMVITILAIISVAVFPKFINVVDASETVARETMVESVRQAIVGDAASTMLDSGFGAASYPANLGDGNAAISDCSSDGCFTGLFTDPVYDAHWSFDGTDTYTYTEGDGTTYSYTYDSSDGSFPQN